MACRNGPADQPKHRLRQAIHREVTMTTARNGRTAPHTFDDKATQEFITELRENYARQGIIQADRPAGAADSQGSPSPVQDLETERSRRVEAERLGRIKDEFLANLSHEIRTPLNAILGWSQLLKPGTTNEAEMVEGLEVITRNARTQARLIDDLLDMSRIISGKMRLDVQRVDLQAVIEAAIGSVKPAADAKGIKLQKVIDPIAGPATDEPKR